MYSTCLFCNARLGRNAFLPEFPVGIRLAFDAWRGRLWVICPSCFRWNLTPIEERWEAIEACERRFRQTRLRFSTDHIGLAYLPEGVALVRIGRALPSEIAAWRYGRHLRRWLPEWTPDPVLRFALRWSAIGRATLDLACRRILRLRLGYDATTWLRVHLDAVRVVAVARGDDGERAVIRMRHVEQTALLRPDPAEPWRLLVGHDGGLTTLSGDTGLRVAGKLLALINRFAASEADIGYALTKLEDAGNPGGYFARVARIAMRTRWGRVPNPPEGPVPELLASSEAERIALHLTKRSFWGRGAFGCEPRTLLPRLPVVDRLALEMAANEDTERRALEGELAVLAAAWREAEELAAIADGLFSARGCWGEAQPPIPNPQPLPSCASA